MGADRPLEGKVALVTGASRGLGAAIARRLFSDGADLLLAARDGNGLYNLADSLDSARVEVWPVDLANPADLERFLDCCVMLNRGIEIVVNNAAITGPIGDFEKLDFTVWREVFQTNFFAPVRICQRLIEPMRRAGRGKIINLSGGGATSPRPQVSAYGTSKCALVRFSETLAAELKETGIDVNCIAPGAMNTRMLQDVLEAGPAGAVGEYERALHQQQIGGAPPEKAAALISFLASPASDGISGRLISAVWDNWQTLAEHRQELAESDIYTLRRIVPEDRKLNW